MKEELENSERFRISHLMILVCYTIFSVCLVGEAFLLHWEKWALMVMAFGLLGAWILHIRQLFTSSVRLWIYSLLMMVTYFFYGTHRTSTFDLAPVIMAVIMIFTMTGMKPLITLCQVTFFITFLYDLTAMTQGTETLSKLAVSRILLHMALVILAGWVGRKVIDRWRELLKSSDEEIIALKDGTRRLNDFLTNISHEIRTPVNAVVGLTGVCIEKEKDPGIRLNLLSVAEAGRRVGEQISDILDYSEIEMDKLAVSHEDYMLSSLINDVVVAIDPQKIRDIELLIDVDPTLPSVMNTDVMKLKRIMWHLITNGLKYTKEGGVYVRVTSERREYGINLIIEVTDTGVGMSEEEIESVFDDFFQADSGRTRSTTGLGLGLVIVSGFVKSLKGFLSIESKLGRGTTVRVSIPQTVVDYTECMYMRNPESLSLGAYLHIERYRNPQIREAYSTLMKNLVQGLKIQVHRAESAEGFKKLLKGMNFSHILLGQEEYEECRGFISALSGSTLVAVIGDSDFRAPAGSGIKIIRKPFYCFNMVSILNANPSGLSDKEGKLYCPGVKALVVDDEPMNLVVALSIFKRYGMTVFTAESGRESIDLTRANDYDIIFMDHMMPGMDGVEAMKIIRTFLLQEGRNIPIVALTANAMSTAKEMFLSEGFDGFVSKPVELSDLERVLRRVLPKNLISDLPPESEEEENAGVSDKKDDESFFRELFRIGIDTEKGLHYCQYDREFYKTLLLQYASDASAKIKDAERFRLERDLPNYAIIVHAIKSTSKMIGALSFSDSVKTLEEAAKDGSEGLITELHEPVMKRYTEITSALLSLSRGEKVSGSKMTEDSDVMEFFPVEPEENEGGEA